MKRIVMLLAIAATSLLGCSKKETAPVSAPAPEAVQEQRAPEAAAAPAPAQATVDCDKLLSKALREKFFAGMTMTQKPICPGCPEECKFRKDESDVTGPGIMYDCRSTLRPGTKEMMLKSGFKEASGPGKLAFANGPQLTFWDETECQTTITWFDGSPERVKELANAVEAELTSATLGR